MIWVRFAAFSFFSCTFFCTLCFVEVFQLRFCFLQFLVIFSVFASSIMLLVPFSLVFAGFFFAEFCLLCVDLALVFLSGGFPSFGVFAPWRFCFWEFCLRCVDLSFVFLSGVFPSFGVFAPWRCFFLSWCAFLLFP